MTQIKIAYRHESRLMAYNSVIFDIIKRALTDITSDEATSVVDTLALATVDQAPVFLSQAQVDCINYALASRGYTLQLE
jgi:hypothetical protein